MQATNKEEEETWNEIVGKREQKIMHIKNPCKENR